MTTRTAEFDRALGLTLLALWTLWTILRFWGVWSIDMSAIYFAGRMVAEGQAALIHGAADDSFGQFRPAAWAPWIAERGVADEKIVHYVYPPIWAWVVAPVARAMEPQAFFDMARIPITLSCAASILMAWRIMRPPMPFWVFVAVSVALAETTMPTVIAFGLNQPQMVVLLLILVAFERFLAGRDSAAGIALGLAAAIKVTPILFCLIFLAERRFRPAAWAAGTAAAIALVSLAVAGPELHWIFLDRMSEIDELVPFEGLNLTFETAMHDLLVPLTLCTECAHPYTGLDTPWVTLASRVLFVVSLGLALWLPRRLAFAERVRLRLVLVFLAASFFSPLAWIHYYALPVLLFPGLWGRLAPRPFFAASAVFWVGIGVGTMGTLVRASAHRTTLDGFDPQHLGLLSLAALVWTLLAIIRRADRDRPQAAGLEAPDTRRLPA